MNKDGDFIEKLLFLFLIGFKLGKVCSGISGKNINSTNNVNVFCWR